MTDWIHVRSELPTKAEVEAGIVLRRVTMDPETKEERVTEVRRDSKRVIPPEGELVPYFNFVPGDPDQAKFEMLCARSATRIHGKKNDGSRDANSPCGHKLKDHIRVYRYPDNRWEFRQVPCKDCHCEGFTT